MSAAGHLPRPHIIMGGAGDHQMRGASHLMISGAVRRDRWIGIQAWGTGAKVEVAARAGAGAAAGALEVVIFRAREGAGGHQMRGGWGPSQCMCDRDMETETRRFGRKRQDYPGGLFKALSVQASWNTSWERRGQSRAGGCGNAFGIICICEACPRPWRVQASQTSEGQGTVWLRRCGS